jgi:hypothetical protein
MLRFHHFLVNDGGLKALLIDLDDDSTIGDKGEGDW